VDNLLIRYNYNFGEKMKSLVFIVLLVLAGIAGYNFINKPTENVEVLAVVENATTSAESVEPTSTDESITEEAVAPVADGTNMITPADMSEEAQHEMYTTMMNYNKCMMQDRPEYHQDNMRMEDIAGVTLAACEPNLDTLKLVLEANNVNVDLREGMIKTVRQRATRKLMSAVMQTQASRMMANEAVIPTP
tara:strand:+ start:802 stop:1374 length:573 start_codon:yes stop_codon:yes gene_type:complete